MSGFKSKWKEFHSKYCPFIPADEVNTGDANVPCDWSRLACEDVAINGISVASFSKSHNNFQTIQDLRNFFAKVILGSIKQEDVKDRAINYLLKTFHQGGLMYPVSGSLTLLLFKEAKVQPRAHASNRQLRISTTEEGFKIQEFYAVSSLVPMSEISEELQKEVDDEGCIKPQSGAEFILEAEACINVNFLANAENPEITIESNHISYGNDKVMSLLDKRHFLQILIDFFMNLLNLNKVIVPPKMTKDLQVNSQPEQQMSMVIKNGAVDCLTSIHWSREKG